MVPFKLNYYIMVRSNKIIKNEINLKRIKQKMYGKKYMFKQNIYK